MSGFDDIIAGAQRLKAQIPDSARQHANPDWVPGPELKAQALAMLCHAILNALNSPQLQPLIVKSSLRPTGWTIEVDLMPPSEHSDIEVVGPQGQQL